MEAPMVGPPIKFFIRKLTPEDLPALLELWRSSGLPHEPRGRDSLESLLREMELNPEGFIGAFHKGEMIGALIASYDGRRGWINRLAVRPGYRRTGVATALIKEAERVLAKRGARVVAALVYSGNEPSLSLFSKLGYEIRRDILYLRKSLTGL